MTPRMSVPTDNIYKFYALFGLVLLLSSIFGIVYSVNYTNQELFSIATQIGLYKEDGTITPFEEGQIEILEKLRDILMTDKKFYSGFLTFTSCAGMILMIAGFFHWHIVVQRRDDKYIELRIRLLEKELSKSQVPKRSLRRAS